jgi:hypothetical protein
MREDRIAKLSQRFKQHAVGRQPTSPRTRIHRSFYLDVAVVERLNKTYRAVNHGLHPHDVSKSVFLETVIGYALDHVADIQASLAHEEPNEDAEPTAP